MIKSEIYLKEIHQIASQLEVRQGSFLVTGATGLIGSCIIDVLISANQLFDCDFKIYALGRNEKKLVETFGNNNINYVVQDITNPILIDKIDYIIHAASNADPKSYALYPVETILTNVMGAKSVLEYCKNRKTRALLTSSFEVYGKLDQDIYSENQYGIIDLNLIRSCYPVSKRASEMLFKSYSDEYGVDSVIARLSSVYGPTMKNDDSKAHAQFLRNALLSENIVLKSKGTQLRTYCYLMDAVSGIFAVLFRGLSGEIYNVANENSIATIAEVAQIIADISGTKVIYEIPDELEQKGFSKPQNCILDTTKIKQLNWNAKYDLRSGISNTLNILNEIKI